MPITAAVVSRTTLATPPKKKKRRLTPRDVLRRRVPTRYPVAFQPVPMNVDAINAALTAANS